MSPQHRAIRQDLNNFGGFGQQGIRFLQPLPVTIYMMKLEVSGLTIGGEFPKGCHRGGLWRIGTG